MPYPVKQRIKKSIKVSKSKVFIRSDFSRFGSYSQIGRALKALVGEGVLVRAGHGIYVEAVISSFSGKPIPTVMLMEIGLRVMEKLGVEADVGYFQRLYRDGKSTQIPMKDVIAVSRPVSRRIYLGKRELIYERLPKNPD